jgi:hypothetical protein
VAAAAVAAVIALAAAACTTMTPGAAVREKAPAVIVLKQGADNGNGDIFITPAGGSVSGPEIISNTGKVIWFTPLLQTKWPPTSALRLLGGKHSTFRLKAAPGQVLDRAGEVFAYQHDPEAIGNDEYTLFDDESDGGAGLLSYSRVITEHLDLATKVATLVKSVKQPEGYLAGAEGNAQFPSVDTSYRAYRLPWHPAT